MQTTSGLCQIEGLPRQIYVDNSPIPPKYLLKTTENKSYIPISGCVLDHILASAELSHLEKLFYISADSLSLINASGGKQRGVALPSHKWAVQLGCSRSQVFKLQQSLSEKGYFIIIKAKNKSGQNKRNFIIPTLPSRVFDLLVKSSSRAGERLPYNPMQESKRTYLDRTKLFIRLNYQLLKTITSNEHLTSFHKVLWLDLFTKCYKYHVSNNKESANFSIIVSYIELADKYSCDKRHLSKAMNILEEVGFISRKRFYIKEESYCQERQDKSLWQIILSIPNNYAEELTKLKDRSNLEIVTSSVSNEFLPIENTDAITDNSTIIINTSEVISRAALSNQGKAQVSSYDPDIAEFRPLLNKDFKTNKNIDNLDSKSVFFKRSEFYKNSFEEKLTKSNDLQNSNFIKDKLQKASLKLTKDVVSSQVIHITPHKSLKDWYPLTKDQVKELNTCSGREFSLNFANELLLKLSNKYPGRVYNFKNQFMSYMTKAFKYEKHQGPMVNHETFKFARNDEKSREERQIEKYLSKIETNLETSPSAQLKRKIAVNFTGSFAYHLLTKSSFTLEEDNRLKVKLSQDFNLSTDQKQVLEREIKLIYGSSVEVAYLNEKSRAGALKESGQGASLQVQDNAGNIESDAPSMERLEHETFIEELDQTSAWYKIRKELTSHFGCDVDKSWFSKLVAEEDASTKRLTLKAPTNFIRDWVKTYYGNIIEQYSRSLNYQLNPFESVITW